VTVGTVFERSHITLDKLAAGGFPDLRHDAPLA
jgi:hypothetical protein